MHSSVVSAKTGPRMVVATETTKERAKASSSSIFENERRSPSQPTPEMRAMKLWYLFEPCPDWPAGRPGSWTAGRAG